MTQYILKERPASGGFAIDYAKELNPQQLEVVTAPEGPALVIAGAGSGKTRVLTYRVARLIESGVSPAKILLVTFTNKAAREMLNRVGLLIKTDIRHLWGGTFHHIGNLILRRHADLVGYQKSFTIIDRDDAVSLMEECAKEVRRERNVKRLPKGDALIEVYSYALNTLQEPQYTLERRYPQFLEFFDEVIMLFNRYTARKQEQNMMDFDDLLTNWRKVLGHREIREKYAQTFRAILVDEYQDTNRLQSDIIETMAGESGNLMVVGDDAQSIYSFRGASFDNIIDFPKRFPACRIYKLEANYRSTPEILSLANDSILNNKRQHRKTLQAVRPSGRKPEVVYCRNPLEQANFVAQRIEEIHDEGTDFRDIAVLYRAHYHAMELQMELTRRGIPFEVRSGIRFFEQAHIKDVTAYLRIIANPRDEVAWKRVVQLYPKIGKTTADKIWRALAASPDPLSLGKDEQFVQGLGGGVRESWKTLVKTLDTLAQPAMTSSPAEMIEYLLTSGYEDYMALTFPNAGNRADDIRQLANYALGFDDLASFLAELSLMTNIAGEDVVDKGEVKDTLILSTIHQAKGLEWKSVFIIWLVDGRFPDGRSMREAGGAEEERRLFYVASTRAKERLYLTLPIVAREGAFMDVVQRPSPFLKELDHSLYEESSISYESPDPAGSDDRHWTEDE